ncbi:MAG: DUF4147 domain-containing protein [Melioribacteraceae bacterium]|nr:DUF4147 domain-containing protein [Melioribacteraceae bacterium]MCF8353712.1 DUF4147 domain-containing protein [Melioribacteraceae bacterium]MCF8394965.1 DUF4147 domain-containing protein [Melioribacteraceae bacterium]MCF8418628.1 DUF4147 domain-containing protein [Melioribacteraceae bacterium]
MINHTSNLHKIIDAAIESVKPFNLFSRSISVKGDSFKVFNSTYDLSRYKNIYIIGFGKASALMAVEIEKLIGERIEAGVVASKYVENIKCDKIRILESGHPIADQNSIYAGKKILELLRSSKAEDLVLCLISGGGSSLFEALPDEISLNDFQKMNDLLIKCGMNIEEINSVRKSISLVKGGQLLYYIYPSECISLIISDVPGDDPSVIASGPTVIQDNNYDEIIKLAAKYNIENEIPDSIMNYIHHSEKQTNINNNRATSFNIILGNNKTAADTAKYAAQSLGYECEIYNEVINMNIEAAADLIENRIRNKISSQTSLHKSKCIIFGGETSVEMKGNGKGGRNQHLALLIYKKLKDVKDNFIFTSFGTDGIDGNTNAAGGLIDSSIYKNAGKLKLSAQEYLEQFDSFNFLNKTGGLVITGPTGTNVTDIMIAILP